MGLIIFLILFGLCFFSVPIAASIGFFIHSRIIAKRLYFADSGAKNVYADRFLFYAWPFHSLFFREI